MFGRYLEVMWRDDPKRPFWWVGGWMCAGCREGIVQLLEGISGVVLAVDG